MRWRAAIGAALALILPAFDAWSQDRAELWGRCESLDTDRSDRFASCTALIESGREPERRLAVAFHHRGLLYHWDERDKAVADQSAAIQRDPWYVDAYVARGRAYVSNREYDLAIRDFSEAIRLDPKASRAFVYRGDSYLAKDLYNEALRDFEESIRLNPSSSAAYIGRRKAYEGLGQHEVARRTDPNGWAYSCGILLQEGKVEEAMEHCNKALAIRPDFPAVLLWRGRVLLKGGRRDAAIDDLDRVLRLDQSPLFGGEAFKLRGLAYFGAGRIDKAAADFEAALRMLPDEMLALFGRGLIRLRNGDAAGGAADIAAARAINPDVDVIAAEYGVK